MKLDKLYLDQSTTTTIGLSEISLDRLPSVVALVGKNGSGKTRILELIEKNLNSIITIDKFQEGAISNPPLIIQQIVEDHRLIQEYSRLSKEFSSIQAQRRKNPNDQKLVQKIRELSRASKRAQANLAQVKSFKSSQELSQNPGKFLPQILKEFQANIERIKLNYFKCIKNEEIIDLLDVLPGSDESVITFESLIESIEDKIDYNELKSIYKTSLGYLKKLPHQLVYDYSEVLGDIKKLEKRVSYKRYLTLKQEIKRFLDKDLEWDKRSVSQNLTDKGIQSVHEGYWKLDGRVFNYIEFSDGEKTLFAYALLFFLLEINSQLRIKESIIVIDEPELHLHPDAEIKLIDAIRNIIGNSGQLWIATHSINILSNLNFDEVFLVMNGQIQIPSQKTLTQSLSELMSIEERIIKLSNLISSISDWAFINFMIQCFTKPEVIDHSKRDDRQMQLFEKAIKSLPSNNRFLLDFGAGKGSLYKFLKLDQNIESKINYSALEPQVELHTYLKSIGIKQVFQNYSEIKESSFDFIVLCNVLHEIKLTEWIDTINQIILGLSKGGFLLIIEACILSKGEKVDEIGFLVLDVKELKKLFNLNTLPTSLNYKTNTNEIMCTIISKEDLSPISKDNLYNALKELEGNSLKKIEKIRSSNNQDSLVLKGRNAAFYSQLHINSRLAQKAIKNLK